MRLLILLGLIYLGYRLLKNWMLRNIPSSRRSFQRPADEIDDVMVKDPVCEVYFPRRNGVQVRFGGKAYYFCSEACRDRFLASQHNQNA